MKYIARLSIATVMACPLSIDLSLSSPKMPSFYWGGDLNSQPWYTSYDAVMTMERVRAVECVSCL